MQEGFLRLHRAREGGERIESPRAYLATVVSRLSLDHLRPARLRRETYVGVWLPEPLVASADDDPARKAEMADSHGHDDRREGEGQARARLPRRDAKTWLDDRAPFADACDAARRESKADVVPDAHLAAIAIEHVGP